MDYWMYISSAEFRVKSHNTLITNKPFFKRGKVKIFGNDVNNSILFTHKLEVEDLARVGYKLIIQWLSVTYQKNQSLNNTALLTLELQK